MTFVNTSGVRVSFTLWTWIAPGPQQVGPSVIPALTPVIPALTPVIPALTPVIPRTPSRHSPHSLTPFPAPTHVIPAGSRHSPHSLSSFPPSPTSFPRRRESSALRDWTHRMESCRPQPSCRKRKRQGRQPSPEANMQRALPSAPYFSIGAPTMLPYSVQEPS